MSKNTYPLKLPSSLKKAAADLAKQDGVSLNQFIAAAEGRNDSHGAPVFERTSWRREAEGFAEVLAACTPGSARGRRSSALR